jgi:hypothetical protein
MNPYLIIGALGAVIVAFIVGGFFGYQYRASKVPAELTAQQVVDTQACAKTQDITKGSNDDLQKDRDAIAAKLADSVRQPAACVPVARPTHVCASGAKHAGRNDQSPAATGLTTSWLNTFAATAETYRSELSVCTSFLDKERQPQQ